MRWFYSLPANYEQVSIFQTDKYGPHQGYATKTEAVQAALKAITDRVKSNVNMMLSYSEVIPKLAQEQSRLLRELSEAHK